MSRSSTDSSITMHIKLSPSYAAALDVIGERLGVNRSELFETGVRCVADRLGITDLPRRLPIPGDTAYEQYLKISYP